jgi:malate synthase
MSQSNRISVDGLKIAEVLHNFIIEEALPGTGIDAAVFWQGLDRIVQRFAPLNRALLQHRDELQAKIDDWYKTQRGRAADKAAHRAFLEEIGYLVPEGPSFQVDTADVDAEIAAVSGPQLVVPISNARYALNAANARWGSLYDALYGSDAIPRDGAAAGDDYDPERGRQVIAWTRRFLDDVVPLASGSHAVVRAYSVKDGTLAATLGDGATIGLAEPAQFRGYRGPADTPERVCWSTMGSTSTS